MDLKRVLLAVDGLQDFIELRDERPEGAGGDDKQEDAVHLPPQCGINIVSRRRGRSVTEACEVWTKR